MYVIPPEVQSLRAALRNFSNHLDANFDPRAETEKTTVPPAIGGEWLGGIYVGPTLDNNDRAELVLLPDIFKGTWNGAAAWAEKQGGTLPSRIDQLVLLLNARDQFEPEWYWSSESVAGNPEYAWCQSFDYGYQGSSHKNGKLRARAVRRVPIR